MQTAVTNQADRYPHLSRAPIIEAVIDWRAKLAPDFDIRTLKEVVESSTVGYRLVDEQRQFQQVLEQAAGKPTRHSFHDLGVRGYRLQSADSLHIANFKHDGFSFSRLKPYTDWRSVFTEAEKLWQVYRSAANPEEVSRIAVRFINRIPLPLPVTDFGRYLTTPPSLPPGVPDVMSSLLFRVVVHEPQSGISTNITQVIEGQQDGASLALILDIDAYIMKSVVPDGFDFAPHFEVLREMKNRVFFATLTETAVDMFK